MGKKLIIVESPAKARTLASFLNKSYLIESSVGHIRDLPKTRFGIDIDHQFEPEYIIIPGKKKVVEKIRRSAGQAEEILLAADPDREGEAICWHLKHFLEDFGVPIHRITYFEITRNAILASLENPRDVDTNKVYAQQARRILDRIVGYRLSPFLWKKVQRGLSAGRVQSVALKLICDREEEIQAFKPEEYWTITATLTGSSPPSFKAFYFGQKGRKHKIKNKEEADRILSDVQSAPFEILSIETRRISRKPPAPFITSTLQQEAAQRLRFSAKKTMQLAQSLYEGRSLKGDDIHGLITYMRTDSPRIGKDAQKAARSFITGTFGSDFIPPKPPVYRGRKSAQDAHEAIRPTSIDLTPQKAAAYLQGDELKLYKLIWTRFIASQMAPAIINTTTVKIAAGNDRQCEFRAVGSQVAFPGFMELTGTSFVKEKKKTTEPENGTTSKQILPANLEKGQVLTCSKLDPEQHFTKPPPRFSEATLVKELEAKGIGRPSTYATILSTIRSHDYVTMEDRRFKPTELGFTVSRLLSKHFPEIMSVAFTADMETKLDLIEAGKTDWRSIVSAFYASFEPRLKKAEQINRVVVTSTEPVEGVVCPVCGGPMVTRWGKNGAFLSCLNFPKCKGSRSINGNTGKKKPVIISAACPECGAPLALKQGRFGLFLSCSRYPACKGKGPKAEGLPCAREGCEGTLVLRRGKRKRSFYGCSRYPECDFTFNGVPIPIACPECGNSYQGAYRRKEGLMIICPRCQHKTRLEEETHVADGTGDSTVSDVS